MTVAVLERAALAGRAREMVADVPAEHMRCLDHAEALCEILRPRGVKPRVALGEACWRFLRHDLDDGQAETHFGYAWRWPREFHAWVTYETPDGLAHVDTTLIYQERQARELCGHAWSAEPLPDFLWLEPGEDLPRLDARYSVRAFWDPRLGSLGENLTGNVAVEPIRREEPPRGNRRQRRAMKARRRREAKKARRKR